MRETNTQRQIVVGRGVTAGWRPTMGLMHRPDLDPGAQAPSYHIHTYTHAHQWCEMHAVCNGNGRLVWYVAWRESDMRSNTLAWFLRRRNHNVMRHQQKKAGGRRQEVKEGS